MSRRSRDASVDSTTRSRFWLLFGYAALTFLSFPHPIGGVVLDLGRFVSWFGPALLIAALEGVAPGRAARLAFLGGLAAHTAILHWIYIVTVVYGHAPVIAGFAGPLGLGIYIAVFPAMFGATWAALARAGFGSPWVAAAAWTLFDHFRSFALSGFPWATLGYAQHANSFLLELAPYTGVYGLSFVTVLAGAAVFAFVRAVRRGERPGGDVWLAAVAVVAVHVFGAGVADPDPDRDLPRIRVAVLQGNVDQGVKWSPDRAEAILSGYEELARAAADDGAGIIVWPETALSGFLDVDPELRRRISDLAIATAATQVIGAVGLATDPRDRSTLYFDSAYVVAPDGRFVDRYDKSHLVPFGEYVPARDLLGTVLRAVARGIAPDNVTPGPGPRALAIPDPRAPGQQVKSGVPICYELLFPDLVRRMVADGAEILFAITNDAWYGRTGAPYQFLAMTALRSAETRVWTARAANTGVSAIIDSRGRVRSRTRIFERDWLAFDVPLRGAPRGGSFYARHGDLFAMACWAAIAMLAIVGWRRGKESPSEEIERRERTVRS